jgi:hypothetical protein
MRIELKRPHPDYPFGWVSVSVGYKSVDPEKFGFDTAMVLIDRNITMLGPWETVSTEGSVITLKAPVLLEDEHIKPRKKATPKTTAKKAAPARRK